LTRATGGGAWNLVYAAVSNVSATIAAGEPTRNCVHIVTAALPGITSRFDGNSSIAWQVSDFYSFQ
jgi:hypothetical protein